MRRWDARPSRSAPVLGRSNERMPKGLGKPVRVGAIWRCCARGRAHSAVAFPAALAVMGPNDYFLDQVVTVEPAGGGGGKRQRVADQINMPTALTDPFPRRRNVNKICGSAGAVYAQIIVPSLEAYEAKAAAGRQTPRANQQNAKGASEA